jgi:hypothetical protein
MATQTTGTSTSNQLTVHTDRAKIFIWNNRYERADYTAGGSPVTLLEGTVMGRIATTRKVVPMASGAADGSQIPLGILKEDYSLAAGQTAQVWICVSGDVAEEKLILAGSDTLDTVVAGQTIRDRIASLTLGVKLVKATRLTETDN